LRAEINAISDMANMPFNRISEMIIIISFMKMILF